MKKYKFIMQERRKTVVKKKLYQILVFTVIFIVIGIAKVYSVSEPINQTIVSWHSEFTTSESTDEKMREWKSELLEKLKSTFTYDGNRINEMMAMKTKINITNDPEKDSTCKIRVRRKRSKRIKWKI